VATHQAHLAKGLASAGLGVSLLATNVRASCVDDPPASAPLPIYRMWAPLTPGDWVDPRYVRRVGLGRLLRYAAFTARQPRGQVSASRRVLLSELLWYAHYLEAVRPQVVHVQHPLERQLYVRLVERLEGWRPRVIVTLHSLFGEHEEAVIHGMMAPNLRTADALIAVSPHVAEQAIQLGADPRVVRVIPSGVDVEHFRPIERAQARAALGLAAEQVVVLFVGTLEPRKQVDRLLHALPIVRKSIPAATLVLVGTGQVAGSGDQTDLLHRIVRDNRLDGAVRFAGRVSAAELVQWYSAADVFALPSSSEGQGIAALEAMACQLPVVGSNVGGLQEMIDDGHTGLLVPPGDVPALAARLIELLRDGCLRAWMGAAARDMVSRRFSWARTVTQTLGVYEDVLVASRTP
jgi:glycosyltransferase involved in cell wall biosynthesis